MQNLTTVYVGAVMAIVALSILGAILRFQAVRRNRARMNVFAVPPIPVYPHNQNGTMPMYLPAMQPPGQFSPSPHYGQRQSWAPRPGFPNPAFSPPQPYPPPPGAAYPSSPYPPAPSSPKFFPNPIPTSPPNPAHSRSGSHSTSPPHPISEKRRTNPSSEQMSLVDRMQEVQTLMLEIHRLESDPGSNNRVRIQELQRRVTELSDTGNSNVATSGQVLGPPPAYAQDGRDPA